MTDDLLRAWARANAAKYLFIGIVERHELSMHMLRRSLDISSVRDHTHIGAHENALEGCISPSHLPSTEFPTDTQRRTVSRMLAADVELYWELDARLTQLAARA